MSWMSKKIKKNLFLPDWIAEIIDREGAKTDGAGVVVSAAVYNFNRMPPNKKIETLQAYTAEELKKAYDADASEIVHNTGDDAAKQRQTHGRHASKAG